LVQHSKCATLPPYPKEDLRASAEAFPLTKSLLKALLSFMHSQLLRAIDLQIYNAYCSDLNF